MMAGMEGRKAHTASSMRAHMSEYDMHEQGMVTGLDYAMIGRMREMEARMSQSPAPIERSMRQVQTLFKSQGDVFDDLRLLGDEALAKAEALMRR